MSIYQAIQKDKLKVGANRPLLSLIMSEICVDGKPMNDNDAIKRLSQMVKVCGKNIDIYTKAENTTMALSESVFRDMIETYLPKGADEQDIESAIRELGVDRDVKSMGKGMTFLKGKFSIVDGNLVRSALVGGSK